MIVRSVSALAGAFVLASVFQTSFAEPQNALAPLVQYKCGEAFDPEAVAGKTFHGPFQWDGGTVFYMYVTFNADCTMTTTVVPNSSSRTGGRWEQTGDGILWEPVNDSNAVYKGSHYTDGSIQGMMIGRKGLRGAYTLKPEGKAN